MSFPYQDRFWTQTAQFVKSRQQPRETLIAPDEFVDEFPQALSYEATFHGQAHEWAWLIVHKGRLNLIHHPCLLSPPREIQPVFANEVFVVFSTAKSSATDAASAQHVRALFHALKNWQGPRPTSSGLRLHPRPDIARLTTEEIRQEMNERYARAAEDDPFAGYEHVHLWDKVRFDEVNRAFVELIGPVAGLSILELACGMGRNVPQVLGCARYVGNDLSDVAIERARRRFAQYPHLRFHRGDATQLDVPERDFDLVLAIEVAEHVHDLDGLLRHAFRVLKPGGRLLINSANRDSLHLRLVRGLGLPEFRATNEHIREFSFVQMKEILTQHGFVPGEARGVFLTPFLGVPGVDGSIRQLADDDPTIVEVFFDLGQRAGPDYTYEFVVSAHKP